MPLGLRTPLPMKLVTAPPAVMRPIDLLLVLVNHRAPSGPATIPKGCAIREPVYCDTLPSVVMRPIEPPMPTLPEFVNHNAPSGPTVIPFGRSMPPPAKPVMAPAVVTRPIDALVR